MILALGCHTCHVHYLFQMLAAPHQWHAMFPVVRLTKQLYAGLWHADEESIVTELLEQGCLKLNAALSSGEKYQVRLLLRFFAALSTTNVVSMQAAFGMLDTVVQGAIECIQGGERGAGEVTCLDCLQFSLAVHSINH